MTARSAEDAIDAVLDRVRSIAQCVTQRPIIALRERRPQHFVRVTFAPVQESVRLRSSLAVGWIRFRMTEEFRIHRLPDGHGIGRSSYYYHVLDQAGREILAYHWHPESRSTVVSPHLHLSNRIAPIATGHPSALLPLADLHVATGQVTFADVVRMLIQELQVDPLVDSCQHTLLAYVSDSA